MPAPRISIIYYSATGTIAALAAEMARTAEAAGAEVRLRAVRELAPQQAIDSNPAWRANVDATADVPEAAADDVERTRTLHGYLTSYDLFLLTRFLPFFLASLPRSALDCASALCTRPRTLRQRRSIAPVSSMTHAGNTGHQGDAVDHHQRCVSPPRSFLALSLAAHLRPFSHRHRPIFLFIIPVGEAIMRSHLTKIGLA